MAISPERSPWSYPQRQSAWTFVLGRRCAFTNKETCQQGAQKENGNLWPFSKWADLALRELRSALDLPLDNELRHPYTSTVVRLVLASCHSTAPRGLEIRGRRRISPATAMAGKSPEVLFTTSNSSRRCPNSRHQDNYGRAAQLLLRNEFLSPIRPAARDVAQFLSLRAKVAAGVPWKSAVPN